MDWVWFQQDWVSYLLLPGALAAGLAIFAWFGDRRRMRRSDPDAVGLMPWTNLFFWALFAAVALLGLAARSWWRS
ncbi:MAG TPA: hypothetical protein VHG29_10360 [Novosphingobium sp.]|nr:hypothetical protein [Novosphingobium sp.]